MQSKRTNAHNDARNPKRGQGQLLFNSAQTKPKRGSAPAEGPSQQAQPAVERR